VIFDKAFQDNFKVGTKVETSTKMGDLEGTAAKPSLEAYITYFNKQLGHRSYQSLAAITKAWMYFKHECLDGGTIRIDEYEVDKATILKLIKYVIAHRLGFYPRHTISSALINYEQIIDGPFKAMVDIKFEKWEKALAGSYGLINKAISAMDDWKKSSTNKPVKMAEEMEKYDELVNEILFKTTGSASASVSYDKLKIKYTVEQDYFALRSIHLARLRSALADRKLKEQ
jgi:hypothetical protein